MFVNIQVRKEPEKTPIPTVVIATDKAKEQERISRAREEISTRHEQVHVAHEKVNKCYECLAHCYTVISLQNLFLHQTCYVSLFCFFMKGRLQNERFMKQGIPNRAPALQVQSYRLHSSSVYRG